MPARRQFEDGPNPCPCPPEVIDALDPVDQPALLPAAENTEETG